MSTTQVVWTKLVITGVPGMECVIPTTDDGRTLDADGEPLPLEERATICGGPGAWAVGTAFVCKRHAAEVADVSGDSLDAIDAAWRKECL